MRDIFNSTVSFIKHSSNGVQVTLANYESLKADYALCTFRWELSARRPSPVLTLVQSRCSSAR